MTSAASTGRSTLRLATRGSALARAQAGLAAAALASAGDVATELVVLVTTGDARGDTAIRDLPGQGWFTSELERALRDGDADVAVHSAKDLPSLPSPGLVVAGLLERADARDALVTRDGAGLASLPDGATVATSSPRRIAFLRALRPGLRAAEVRGNVDTRLRRLDEGAFDALLLACAGLDRLGLGGRIAERLDPTRFVPAPAQGAIALQARAGDAAEAICAAAADAATVAAVAAERTVLHALGGGCLLPLGAWARVEDGHLVLTAALAAEGLRRAEAAGDLDAPEELGARVAERLR